MRPDVYICSKPLQFFNIKNIGEIEGMSRKKVLIIDPRFSNGKSFVELLRRYDNDWDEIISMNGQNHYYDYIKSHKINYLFVENDASFKMTMYMCYAKLFKRVNKLFVFEEGIGTYRNDLHRGLDKVVRNVIGVGSHYGASFFSDNVILYEPGLYNKKFNSKKAIPFANTFVEGLKKNDVLLSMVCDRVPSELEMKNKKILMYISNHTIDNNIILKMVDEKNKYDFICVKPHPHITKFDDIPDGIFVVKTNILVEFIIYNMLKNGNNLTVWHQASTSLVYFMDMINSHNFTSFPIFDELVSYRQSNNKM